ncbi:MAG: ABC transporter permease subunit [Alphaproteobacteria bacterium]|nr:ABC transporter permease subunit [Alphaproteobacteria bacterium]
MSRRERIGFGALTALVVLAGVGAVGLMGVVLVRGLPALGPADAPGAALGPALLGTFGVTAISAAFSAGPGVCAGIYLSEYAGDTAFTRAIRIGLRTLAGVPPLLYGLFGALVFVYGAGLGPSMLAAGLTLGLLSLPWIISTSEAALRAVPQDRRRAALALGASRWQLVRTCVLPEAAPELAAGVGIGVARACGETAPLLFTGATLAVIGPPGGLRQPFMALPYQVYALAIESPAVAFGPALVLLALVLAIGGGSAVLKARARARRLAWTLSARSTP